MKIALLLTLLIAADEAKKPQSGPERWESTIKKFEEADRTSPPTPGGVLFVGSSSIRLWDLEESFPGKGYLNRGFGGSEISDLNHFIDRIVFPYRPKTIVLYSGDNDIAKKKSPEQVFADFKTFSTKVHQQLPETKIIFVTIKPSIRRWELWEQMRAANEMVREYSQQNDFVIYADISKPMLGSDGKPRAELFVKDGLHLSPEGYKLWTKVVQEHL